jgi:hypothetical protein
VQQLPSLQDPLRAPGVYFHWSNRMIYVFGGCGRYGKSLSTCEKLPLSSPQWKKMPSMHSARKYFNPCATDLLVFLVGGWTTFIETYSLTTHNFTQIELELPANFLSSACTAVLGAYSLIALATTMLCEAEEGGKRWKRTQEVWVESAWSNCKPWVQDGQVFVVSLLYGVCRGVNLASGEQTCAISFLVC